MDAAGKPAWSALYQASPAVRLDTTLTAVLYPGRCEVTRSLTRLNAEGGALPDDRRSSFLAWSIDPASDSVKVDFSTGYSGALLILSHARLPDTLSGRAEEHWDTGPSVNQAGLVLLVRMPCSAAAFAPQSLHSPPP